MWKNRIIGYEEVDPEQLLANPRNWRIHPQSQQEALEGVLDEVGWVDDIIVNQRTGFVLDGHLRVALAISQSQKTVPVKYIDVTEDEEMVLLATFDPITAMAVADKENLAELMMGIDSDNERIQGLLDDIAKREGIELETKEAPEAQIDRADELQKKWKVKRGQVWKIGRHRLMCGDSTEKQTVDRLMDGKNANMVFTDPPYGMRLDTDYSRIMNRGKSYGSIRGDEDEWIFNKADWFDCNEQFWWGADWYRKTLPSGGSWFVWDKQISEHDGASHTGSLFELCWSKMPHKREIIKAPYFRYYGLDTKERFHPTQKPIKLFVWFINKFSLRNHLIIDLFLGSGSTMVAAEQLNRICYGMEIEPKYCAVTLERMSDMGLKPKLIDT